MEPHFDYAREWNLEVPGAHHEGLECNVKAEISESDEGHTRVTITYPVGGGDLDDDETLFMIFRACAMACLAVKPTIFWDVPAEVMATWRDDKLQQELRERGW